MHGFVQFVGAGLDGEIAFVAVAFQIGFNDIDLRDAFACTDDFELVFGDIAPFLLDVDMRNAVFHKRIDVGRVVARVQEVACVET